MSPLSEVLLLRILLFVQGADKSGKAPDGSSYFDSAESSEVKDLLK